MLACPKTATEKSGKRRGEIPPQTPFRPACLAEQGLGWEASPLSWYQDIKTKHFSIPFRRKGAMRQNWKKRKMFCFAPPNFGGRKRWSGVSNHSGDFRSK